MSSNLVFLQYTLNSFKSDLNNERFSEIPSKVKDIVLSELEVLLCACKENNLYYVDFRKIHVCTFKTLLIYYRDYDGFLSAEVLEFFYNFLV